MPPYKPSKTDKSYFKAAQAMSELSDFPIHRLGAVVVDKHHIISSGCNSYTKCHPVQAKIDEQIHGCACRGCVHAETAALLPLIARRYNLKNAKVYLYRQHKNKTLAMSRPCSGCRSLMTSLGIKEVYYTTEGGYAKEYI